MTVKDVVDFQRDVIEESKRTPILVDFWAPWCGPCRTLGPVLEMLAGEEGASWQLAKLNTDENQAVARQYRIESIPAVKLFVDGEVKDEFVGALPEPQVRKWLEKAVPSETKRLVAEARQRLEQGNPEGAGALATQLLASDSNNADAKVILAAVLSLRSPSEAVSMIKGLQGYAPELQPL